MYKYKFYWTACSWRTDQICYGSITALNKTDQEVCNISGRALPVVQNQNKFSSFEGQLIIFSRLEVIQCTNLPDLLAPATISVVWGVRGQGQGPCLCLLLLLLQGQLDGWERWRFGGEEGRTEAKWKGEEDVCQMSNTRAQYRHKQFSEDCLNWREANQ